MIALLLQFGPWIVGALGVVGGLLMHWRASSQVAAAGQKVAEAQTVVAQAQTQIAETHDAEAQANATAAQAGADSLKEKVNVTNDVAAMPAGAAADELRSQWSKD